MDCAAANGHPDVVKWLQLNRSEGCTSNAMDFAAANGHLEIVQWLHVNTSAGCTNNAMDVAASGGHLNVLKWLRGNRNEGCTVRAIEQALSFGFLKVACWLRQQHPELAPASVTLPSPTEVFGVLLFLSAEYPDLLTTEFARSARDDVSGRFATANDVPISEWLRRNYPVPDVAEEQRERHFAERIAGNIAQQIARQLGGAARVHVVGGQQGGGHDDALGMLMNNFIMVAHDSDDDDVSSSEEEDDDSNSEDDDE